MNDRNHPNHPDYDPRTGEVDEDVHDGEILDPISVGTLATLQRVEIDQQVATAKAYPRNVIKIKQELTALVTMDEDTADDCIYALPRGNKHIKGPSARFADALISFWGNARSGAFIVQVDKDDKFVEAIGSFQDVERNVIRQRRVRRPIVDRYGKIYNADMINMTGNAACVIAERNAILNGIPKSLWGPAYEKAFALVAGTTKSLGEKIERAKKAFQLMNIDFALVLEKIERADESKIVPDDIVMIRGMLTALKTGEETVEGMFGRGAGGSNHERVNNPLKDDPSISTGGPRGASNATAQGGKAPSKTREPDQDIPDAPETASNQAPKTDTASGGAGKAAEGPSDGQVQDTGPVENNAQPATATGKAKPETAAPSKPAVEKPYSDAESYMSFVRDTFDRASSKAAVTEIWGSTRADRNELLNPEQIDELTKDKDAKVAALKLKESK